MLSPLMPAPNPEAAPRRGSPSDPVQSSVNQRLLLGLTRAKRQRERWSTRAAHLLVAADSLALAAELDIVRRSPLINPSRGPFARGRLVADGQVHGALAGPPLWPVGGRRAVYAAPHRASRLSRSRGRAGLRAGLGPRASRLGKGLRPRGNSGGNPPRVYHPESRSHRLRHPPGEHPLNSSG
jgi:hypothetical protein